MGSDVSHQKRRIQPNQFNLSPDFDVLAICQTLLPIESVMTHEASKPDSRFTHRDRRRWAARSPDFHKRCCDRPRRWTANLLDGGTRTQLQLSPHMSADRSDVCERRRGLREQQSMRVEFERPSGL
jgi:hypothetical protein